MVCRVRESLCSNCDDSRQCEIRTREMNPTYPRQQILLKFRKLRPSPVEVRNTLHGGVLLQIFPQHVIVAGSTGLRQHTFDTQTAEQENEEGNVKLTSPELELVQQLFGVIYDSGQGQLLQVGMRAERGYAEHLRDACGKLEEQQQSLEI